MRKIYTVAELNKLARRLLEANFNGISVSGEVSRPARSGGHCYFTIKDKSGAGISAVLFRGVAARLGRYPEDGASVEVRGTLTLYEKGGRYQIIVEHFAPTGEGVLYQRFEELKKKLLSEGLFAEKEKKPLPCFPRHICIVTSPTGAVVHDMLRTLTGRFPDVKISIIPVAVQGESAPNQVAEGIAFADTLKPELIITGRGGGSIEDLWAFNEEVVARAIFRCSTPLISAVGHETDVTIADFVADARASTPTHAAKLAFAKDAAEYLQQLHSLLNNAEGVLSRKLQRENHRLELCRHFRFFRQPELLLTERVQYLENLQENLEFLCRTLIKERKQNLLHLCEKLRLKSPSAVIQAHSLQLMQLKKRMKQAMEKTLSLRKFQGAVAMRRLPRQNPERLITKKKKEVKQQTEALNRHLLQLFAAKCRQLHFSKQKLKLLNPHAPLEKGYAIAIKHDGTVIKSVTDMADSPHFRLRLSDGERECRALPEKPRERPSLFDAEPS